MRKTKFLRLISQFILSLGFASCVWADEPWLPDMSYPIGEFASQNEVRYVATLWNRGNAPQDSISHWEGWVQVDESIALFEWGRDYNGGDIVDLHGELFLAKWRNRNEQPESSWYWRRLKSDDYIDVSGALDAVTDDPKSVAAVMGEDVNKNSVRDSYEAKVLALYVHSEQRRLAMNSSYFHRALHELELDESINLLESEVIALFQTISAWDDCLDVFRITYPNVATPFELYIDTIYRALTYRFGQNEAYRDLNGDDDALWNAQERDYCQYYELAVN